MERISGLSHEEAGRKGGIKLRDQRGPEYYSQIGKLGGAATKANHTKEHYQQIGRKGAGISRLVRAAKRQKERVDS